MAEERIPKYNGWLIAFWLALIASTCWLGVSLYVWPDLLGLLPELFRGRSIDLTDVLLLVAIAQPICIAWLISRAVARRRSRQRWRLVGGGALPLTTLLIFAGAMAVSTLQRHLREQRYLELHSPGNIITTSYICERNHASVDFHRSLLKHVDLQLTSITKIGAGRSWLVREVGHRPHRAETFVYDNESIGGSEGIRWRDPDGQLQAGAISFSDVHRELGPDTIWVYVPLQPRSDIDKGWHPTFTCGPIRQSITERNDR